MEEKKVTFETAKLAFLKGYNNGNKGKVVAMYCVDGELSNEKLGYQHCRVGDEKKYHLSAPRNNELRVGFILAPTQTELQNWLQEEHKLDALELGLICALGNI